MNVILVVADTLRRDYLPCYGNTEVIAPKKVQVINVT